MWIAGTGVAINYACKYHQDVSVRSVLLAVGANQGFMGLIFCPVGGNKPMAWFSNCLRHISFKDKRSGAHGVSSLRTLSSFDRLNRLSWCPDPEF